MHLASSLEPSGPRSIQHYLMFHHQDRSWSSPKFVGSVPVTGKGTWKPTWDRGVCPKQFFVLAVDHSRTLARANVSLIDGRLPTCARTTMHLTSSLQPSGPKSTQHYLILHYEDRRELIVLPQTYSDLEKQAEKLFHLGPGLFHVESKELNICAGERVRIPEEMWSDISELLGNVYVVPRSDDSGGNSTAVQTANLETPLVKDELIVINLGNIDFDAVLTSSTKFSIQIQDGKKNSALTVNIFPHSGLTSLASATNITNITWPLREAFSTNAEHYILIHKLPTRFLLQYDSHYVGTVEAPDHPALTSVTYDFGIPSAYKSLISTAVYSGASQLRDSFGPYSTLFPPMYKEMLLNQLVNCAPRDVARTPKALEALRREIASCQLSSSGAKWRGQELSSSNWTTFEWGSNLHSVRVIRFNLLEEASTALDILFGPQNLYSLQVRMAPDGTVTFSESKSESNSSFGVYFTIKLEESMHTVGEHSVSLVYDSGKLRAIFDFKRSVVLPRTTLLIRKPNDISVDIVKSTVALDVYELTG